MQLVNQDEQHVELANGAETIRHAAEPAAQLSRHVVVELEHRHELAQPARRDPRGVQHPGVAAFESTERAVEPFEVCAQQFRAGGDDGHGEKRHYMVS